MNSPVQRVAKGVGEATLQEQEVDGAFNVPAFHGRENQLGGVRQPCDAKKETENGKERNETERRIAELTLLPLLRVDDDDDSSSAPATISHAGVFQSCGTYNVFSAFVMW